MRLVRSAAIAAVSLVAAVALAACGDPDAPVNVTYDQDSVFGAYRTADDSNGSTSEDGGVYIMYRILRIDNTGSAAKTYTFDSSKVAVDTGQDFSQEHMGNEQQVLGSQFLSKKTIQPGQSLVASGNHSLGCFVIFAKHSNPKSLVGKLLPLDYNPSVGADNNVHLSRDAANKSEAIIVNTVSPSTLRERCDGQFG